MKPTATRSKRELERKIAALQKQIAKYQNDIDTKNYLDFNFCSRCGGSGWYWGGDYGQQSKYCRTHQK